MHVDVKRALFITKIEQKSRKGAYFRVVLVYPVMLLTFFNFFSFFLLIDDAVMIIKNRLDDDDDNYE